MQKVKKHASLCIYTDAPLASLFVRISKNDSYKSQTSEKNVQVWIGSQVKGNYMYSVIVTFPDQDYRAQTSSV